MSFPENFDYTTAFVKRTREFIKFYPLTRKDPLRMVIDTLNELRADIKSCINISELEPLSEIAKSMTSYSNKENLFQIPLSQEKDRYIIFCPLKLLGIKDSHDKEILIIDLLYIPSY